MAAIYVIPKVANSEHIQAEATELYELAKRGMENLIDKQKLNE